MKRKKSRSGSFGSASGLLSAQDATIPIHQRLSRESERHGFRNPQMLLGCVVNPRDGVPVLVTSKPLSGDAHVYIWRPKTDRDKRRIMAFEGEGYLAADYDDASYMATGFPRSHTPGGIVTPGRGYGTSLYCALALFAYHWSEGQVEASAEEGDIRPGVSSSRADRSHDASTWWKAAEGHGLAEYAETEEEMDDVDITRHVDVDRLSGSCAPVTGAISELSMSDLQSALDPDEFDADEVRVTNVNSVEAYGEASCGDVVSVDEINVDLEFTKRLDILPFDSVVSNNLSLFTMAQEVDYGRRISATRSGSGYPAEVIDEAWRGLMDIELMQSTEHTNEMAILACDVRGMPVEMLNLLMVVLRLQAVGEKAIEGFALRWKFQADPGQTPVQLQQSLSFVPNKKDAREVERALEFAREARVELGWSRLADLP